MVRKALGGVMFVMLAISALGCGYSQEKAEARCNDEAFSKAQCVTGDAYNECVACYLECGDGCEAHATCPESYGCDSD